MANHDDAHDHDGHNCKDLLEWLSEYIDGELTGDLYERIKNHSSDCQPCVAFIETLQKTSELIQNKPGIAVPSESMDELTATLQQCKNVLKNA